MEKDKDIDTLDKAEAVAADGDNRTDEKGDDGDDDIRDNNYFNCRGLYLNGNPYVEPHIINMQSNTSNTTNWIMIPNRFGGYFLQPKKKKNKPIYYLAGDLSKDTVDLTDSAMGPGTIWYLDPPLNNANSVQKYKLYIASSTITKYLYVNTSNKVTLTSASNTDTTGKTWTIGGPIRECKDEKERNLKGKIGDAEVDDSMV